MKKIATVILTLPFLTGCVMVLDPMPKLEQIQYPQAIEAELIMTYTMDSEKYRSDTEEFTLSCDPGGQHAGTHPNAEQACSFLLESPLWLQAESSEPAMCTMIYGGPETMLIEGVINGKEINILLSKGNGCEISEWESWSPALPPVEAASWWEPIV